MLTMLRHVGQLNSLGFVVLRLPDVYAGITGIEVDVAPSAAQDFALPQILRLYEAAPPLTIYAPVIKSAEL
jgi:hypothetical protein